MTLTPRGTLNLTKPEELIVNGRLVTDTLGRQIDGNDDGQPGGDYIATISGSRVTVGGLPLARTMEQPANVPAAIDALLARGELTGLTRLPRARSEARLAAKATDTRIGKQFFVVVNLSVARRHGQRQPGGNPANETRPTRSAPSGRSACT